MIRQDGTDTAHLILADWLDDRGESALAQNLREDIFDPNIASEWNWEWRGVGVSVGVSVGSVGGGVGGGD